MPFPPVLLLDGLDRNMPDHETVATGSGCAATSKALSESDFAMLALIDGQGHGWTAIIDTRAGDGQWDRK